VLTVDRPQLAPGFDEVVRVTATIVDAGLVPVPTADHVVTFAVTGPGLVVATDSADNASHESFQANARHAFRGSCVAFIRANAPAGRIAVTASAPGLAPATVFIDAVVAR
jgi:beta-galactosidase